MSDDLINSIPGAAAFSEWYGRLPERHDANATLELDQEAPCIFTLSGAGMASQVASDGVLALAKRCRANLPPEEATSVAIEEFAPGGIILQAPRIARMLDGDRVEIDGSTYGRSGAISARALQSEFRPVGSARADTGEADG